MVLAPFASPTHLPARLYSTYLPNLLVLQHKMLTTGYSATRTDDLFFYSMVEN